MTSKPDTIGDHLTAAPPLMLYAPNVHTGGGFVLLQALLDAWPTRLALRAVLDSRARDRLTLPTSLQALQWVAPTLSSRWAAERLLAHAAKPGDTVLCFHGLPPLLQQHGKVVVFLQNRLYIGDVPLSGFKLRTAARLSIERLQGRLLRRRVTEYIVQTPSMARDLAIWYGDTHPPSIRILPFMATAAEEPPTSAPGKLKWDFVYVADGESHKNHRRLLEAWRLLSKKGFRPSLALTLGPRDHALIGEVNQLVHTCKLAIHNLGHLPHDQTLSLYAKCRALIFPSLFESFGLPLLEAKRADLPVLAPELDYVRDVCSPVETFDPISTVSIARAVTRFMRYPEPPLLVHTPAGFWDTLLSSASGPTSIASIQ